MNNRISRLSVHPPSIAVSATILMLFAILSAFAGSVQIGSAQSTPAPANLQVIRKHLSFTVSFTMPDATATNYAVNCSYNQGSSWSRCKDFSSASANPSTDVPINSNSSSLLVAIQAERNGVSSGWVNSSVIAPVTAPGQIGALTVSQHGNSVLASWNVPADGNSPITSYHVSCSVDGGKSWYGCADAPASYASGAAHTVEDDIASLFGGGDQLNYIVAVRALNALGGGGWRNSGALTLYNGPESPRNGQSRWYPHVGLVLSWDIPSGRGAPVQGYNLNWSLDHGASWQRRAYMSRGSNENVHINAANKGWPYRFALQAVNAVGESEWMNFPRIDPPLKQPANVAAIATGDTLTVTWTRPVGWGETIAYDIVCSSDDGQSWTECGSDSYGYQNDQTNVSFTVNDAGAAQSSLVSVRATAGALHYTPWVNGAVITSN